jgi:Protein of unknown function (DUF2914).
MLRRIDAVFSNVVLISYVLISALSITILNIHEHRRGERERSERLHFIVVFALQFCLGGLFSGAFLFYSRSGSIIASWPFLLMLAGYILGNEALRRNYVRLGFQVTVFFTALFSFLIFFLPVILGAMGDAIFILSGISSLILTGVFVYVLSWFAPARTRASAPILTLSVVAIFAAMNALYFSNIIPPIPLSLKDSGLFVYVTRLPDGSYETLGEEQSQPSLLSLLDKPPVIHIPDSGTLYALTSIFAPESLKTDVVHVWRRFDDSTGAWTDVARIALSISGGRDQGYRTFSIRNGLVPGKWRVDVETPRGALVGRVSFVLVPATGDEELVTRIK